nr:hypothetical protein [Tanacetum cinerariifolium]
MLATSRISLWECRLHEDGYGEAQSVDDSTVETENDNEILLRSGSDDGVDFNESHLLNIPSDLLESIMEHCVEDDGKDKCVSIIDDDTFPKHKFSLSIPVSVKNPRGSLLGSSQGLFFFYKLYNSQFVLWNPTIKKSVAIDLPTNDDELDIVPDHRTTIAFGVCPNTLDAKLVKITSENPFVSITTVIQVEVYTLSSRVWRILASNLPQKSLMFLDWVDVGGFIYWFSQDSVSHSYLITSFDLTSEVFTEVSLPDCLTSNDDNYVFLSKLGDSLVLLEGNNWDIHVWIMKNGDPKSFTPLYTIDMPSENIISVLGFRKNGEPIIEIKRDKNESEIIVYEPNTYRIRYTGIVGQLGTFFASSYIETLLLLDHEDNDNVTEGDEVQARGYELATQTLRYNERKKWPRGRGRQKQSSMHWGEVDYGWNNSKDSRFVKDVVTNAVELGLNKILTHVWKKLKDD